MFYRIVSVFLCSCLLAVSVPQISYASEQGKTSWDSTGSLSGDENISEEENAEDQESIPDPDPEPTQEPEPESSDSSEEPPEQESSAGGESSAAQETSSEEQPSDEESVSSEESSSGQEASSVEESASSQEQPWSEEASSGREDPSDQEIVVVEESAWSEEASFVEESSATVESSLTEETVSEPERTKEPVAGNTEELKYGQSKQITLQSGSGQTQWFQYTATESGYYNFYVEGSDIDDIVLTVYDQRENGKQLKRQGYKNDVRYAVMHVEKGQTVYPSLSLAESTSASSATVGLGVKHARVASVQAADNNYTISTDQFTANIGWKPGSRTVSTSMMLSAKEGKSLGGNYIWQIKYGNSEAGYQYINEQISPDSKKGKDITELDPGIEYSFMMYLLNADTHALEAILIPDNSAIKMQTGSSRENLILRGTRSGYDSITLNIEAAETVSKYCYGPLAGYDEEVTVQKRISGIASISASNLEPATTYYFEFYNSKGVVFGYTTVDTKEYPAKISYLAKATGPDTIAVKADISAYTGKIPGYFNLCYEIVDDAGKLIVSDLQKVSTKGSEQWSVQAQASDLEAETEYTVTMWISEPGHTAHFKETSHSVTTPEAPFGAEMLSVEIVQNAGAPTKADYSVAIADYAENVTGKLKYRMKDSLGEYETKSVNIIKGKAKGFITGLQKGMEYEYEFRVGGIVDRGTFVMGDAAMHPTLSDDTDAYDSILSYKLDSSELSDGAAYSVRLYYYNEETKLYGEIASRLALTADTDYTVSVQAADYVALSPDTVYGFQWELYAGTTLADTQYQLIKTKTSDVTVELTANMADSVSYQIGINGRTENISRDITLFTYLCGEDGEYRKQGDSFRLSASGDYKTAGRILSGLADQTTYTVSFRDAKGSEYGSYTFTFESKIDGVRLNVGNQTAGAHSMTIQTQVEGAPAPGSYLILFFKEKNEEDWDIRSVLLEDDQTECNFELTSYLGDKINADTVYEYVTGISSQQYPAFTADLEGVCAGEILTQTDGRKLENVSAGSGYSYISVKAMLTNNPINTNSYIYVFYREKGKNDWLRSKKSFAISKTTGGMLAFISDLKPGTEYEYIVGVSDISYDVSLNEIEEDRRVTGTVTTKHDDFKVNVHTVKKQDGWSGMEVNVKVDTTARAKTLKAVLTLNDGQTREVLLSRDKNYSADVLFDELYTGKNYAVSNVSLQIMETVTGKCDYVTVASFKSKE